MGSYYKPQTGKKLEDLKKLKELLIETKEKLVDTAIEEIKKKNEEFNRMENK